MGGWEDGETKRWKHACEYVCERRSTWALKYELCHVCGKWWEWGSRGGATIAWTHILKSRILHIEKYAFSKCDVCPYSWVSLCETWMLCYRMVCVIRMYTRTHTRTHTCCTSSTICFVVVVHVRLDKLTHSSTTMRVWMHYAQDVWHHRVCVCSLAFYDFMHTQRKYVRHVSMGKSKWSLCRMNNRWFV